MSDRSIRRLVGGVSAVAAAAGFVVTVGIGSAGAAPGSVTWDDGNERITRTVSNTTPNEGESVTVTTKFDRTGGVVEYIQAIKDLHPTCMTYVPGSARLSGSSVTPEVTPASTRVTGSWALYPHIEPNLQTYEATYRVGVGCERGVPLMTTVHYSGTLGDGTYTDKGPTITVSKNTSSTTLAAISGAQVGAPVTLSATVTGAAQGDSVDFYDGGTKLGSGTLNGSGEATFAWTPSTAGARSLQAKFPGSARANGSDSAVQSVTVSVPVVGTTTTLQVPPSAQTGQQVTLTANVNPANASGTVQFKDNGTDIGSPVSVANGAASLPHTFTSGGSHSITADFIAGSGFVNSSASAQTVTVSVPDVATTTTVTAPGTAQTGVQVTLSADVTPNPGGGTVQFRDNGADIGSPVALSNGGAQLPYTFSAAGQHSITAVFSGAPGFTGSTSAVQTVTVSVPDVETTTTLAVPAAAETGQSVTLTANVDPADASGTVQFQDNGADIGSPVTVSNGVASLHHTFTTAGSHSIAAAFTGSAGFLSSTAPAKTVTVNTQVVQTTLTVSAPSAAQTGAAVTLSAAVNPANASGTVQFTDGGANIGAPVQVSGGVVSLQHTFTTGGAHTIGATFTAAAGFTDATASPQTVQVSVPTPDDTVTTTTATAPTTATVGQSVTLSATVAGGQNLPGTVQFYDGDTPIGGNVALVNGVATLEHTFTTDGAHLITARYSGGQGVKASASQAQTVQVAAGGKGSTGSAGSLGPIFGSLGGGGR